jgi:hypothetical protein
MIASADDFIHASGMIEKQLSGVRARLDVPGRIDVDVPGRIDVVFCSNLTS